MKINEITLLSKNTQKLKTFYHSILELPIIETSKGFTVILRHSKINFIIDKEAKPYHFAITIPANKIIESLQWLKQKVQILKDGANEIIDFPAWNAESVYFYDADKNIVEFISRKSLDNSSTELFSSEDLLNVSEMGLATENFESTRNLLISRLDLKDYGFRSDTFNALGDENGLIILINKDQKKWIPTNDKAFASPFIAEIENMKNRYQLEFRNERLHITES